jgi:hypothetical protein
VDSLREQEKPKARKMLENGAESHQSAARFVGQAWLVQDSLTENQNYRQCLDRLDNHLTRFYNELCI